MGGFPSPPAWGDFPIGLGSEEAETGFMKTIKSNAEPHMRTHVPAEDRVRTLSGKTTNSKVRSEGRHLAALERSSEIQHDYLAREAKEKV